MGHPMVIILLLHTGLRGLSGGNLFRVSICTLLLTLVSTPPPEYYRLECNYPTDFSVECDLLNIPRDFGESLPPSRQFFLRALRGCALPHHTQYPSPVPPLPEIVSDPLGNLLVDLGDYALDQCVFCVTTPCNPHYTTCSNPTGQHDLTLDTHYVVWCMTCANFHFVPG